MDRYIYVCSSDSDKYFNDNTASKFKVRLNRSLDLTGEWKVALIELEQVQKQKKGLKKKM